MSTYDSIKDRSGCIFGFTSTVGFLSITGPMMNFISDRPVFIREKAKGIYNSSAYFISG